MRRTALFLALCAALPALAADEAGIVLASRGAFTASRPDQPDRPLQRRSPVYTADLLRTGADGYGQVRFSDGGLMAFTAGTEFRVRDYRFGTPGQENASFELLKGGLRVISGKIGKERPEAYKVETRAGVLGIRGTHYLLRVCADDCPKEGGGRAENGVYGGVLQGSITFANHVGTSAFDAGQWFFVSNLDATPRELLFPPDFLVNSFSAGTRDARGGESREAHHAARTEAHEEAGEAPGERGEHEAAETHVTQLNSEELAQAIQAANPTPPPGGAAYAEIGVAASANGPVIVRDVFDGAAAVVAWPGLHPFVEQGSVPVAGLAPIQWGRWIEQTAVSDGTPSTEYGFTMFLPTTTIIEVLQARSGTVGYQFAGGSVVDSAGNVGRLSGSSSITVDFDRQLFSSVDLSMAVGDHNITAGLQNGPVPITPHSTNLTLTGSCTGGSCGAGTGMGGWMDAYFVGNKGEQIAAPFTLTGGNVGVAGAAVFAGK